MKEKTTEMKIINELLVTALANQFVESLNGRYKQYVSDIYLASHLKHECWHIMNKPSNVDQSELVWKSAYLAGCIVFWDILEIDCKVGEDGSGDNVAQEFARLFAGYKLER